MDKAILLSGCNIAALDLSWATTSNNRSLIRSLTLTRYDETGTYDDFLGGIELEST